MSHDPIIDEVRAIRDAIAREQNYDLDSIFRMFRDREARSREPHVTLPSKPLVDLASPLTRPNKVLDPTTARKEAAEGERRALHASRQSSAPGYSPAR